MVIHYAHAFCSLFQYSWIKNLLNFYTFHTFYLIIIIIITLSIYLTAFFPPVCSITKWSEVESSRIGTSQLLACCELQLLLSNKCIPPADALTWVGIISGVLRAQQRTTHTGRLWDDFHQQIPTLCVTFSLSCNHSGNRMSNHLCKLFVHPETQASSQDQLSQQQCLAAISCGSQHTGRQVY